MFSSLYSIILSTFQMRLIIGLLYHLKCQHRFNSCT